MKRVSIILFAALALAACGKRQGLEPAAGKTLPVAARGLSQPAQPDQLMRFNSQARPNRIDDPNTNSERRDDPFDLPPPG
ncbi:hypothetical protein [Sphingomonas sp. ID0503]|uniref:hypothetical protein n=1 Tax=Sphingomonas sp. ID0503 TaxID=3399691 RepID=UPI003AFA5A68